MQIGGAVHVTFNCSNQHKGTWSSSPIIGELDIAHHVILTYFILFYINFIKKIEFCA